MPVDKFGRMSDAKTRDTGVSLIYISNNYIGSDGSTPVSGSINMNGNTLNNIPDPVNPQDVATKEYADNVRRGGWVRRKQDGTYTIKRDLDMNDKRLKNVPPPLEDADAVNKEYVDKINAFEVRNGEYNAKSPLYIVGKKIGDVTDPTKDGEAVYKRYVDDYVEEYVEDYIEKFKDKNGIFVLPWKVNIVDNKLSGLSVPSKSDEAATKEYADKVGNDVREYVDQSTELLGRGFHNLPFAFLKDNGNFVAHTPISMASQPLNDLPEPKKTSDAVTKKSMWMIR